MKRKTIQQLYAELPDHMRAKMTVEVYRQCRRNVLAMVRRYGIKVKPSEAYINMMILHEGVPVDDPEVSPLKITHRRQPG
jgi:hypothetical protein